jgi:hypothetical protein
LGILFSILSSLALAVVGQRSLALPLIIRAGENQRTAGLLVLALFAIAGSFFGMHGIDRLAAVLMLLLLARQAWPLFRRMLASRKSGNVHRPLAEWLAARAMRDRRRYLLAWLSALLEEKTLDRADIEKMIAHELASHDFHIAGNILVRLDADGGSTAQLDGLLGELLLEGRIRMVGNRFIAYPRRTPCS